MKRLTPRQQGLLAGMGVVALISSLFAFSYFATAAFYQWTRLSPPGWLTQVVNSLLGLFLTGLVVGSAGRLARARGWVPERNLFAPLVDAMQRIAKGDFSVRVADHYRDNEMVSVLVRNMNAMALELTAMEALRQEFISNVSHEIQSPLTSIRGFAQALRAEHLSAAEREHYLAIIETESRRLSRLTENLLALTTLEAAPALLERRPFRLDSQIRQLVLASEPQWLGKNIDVEVAAEEITFTGDEDRLSQVWVNLLHNSLKFTPPGGRVSLSLRRQPGQVEFQITDTGIGLSAEDQARVFERFFKADPARDRAQSGSGLGLAIAKKIVEMHHGTIQVRSQLNLGATFTVTLPAP